MNRYRKFIAAIVGAVLVAVSEGVFTGSAATAVPVVVSVLTALGVYQVPNDAA